jgi:SpoVK/Ycf46/Vps4 family AAA+-type ATPase
MMHSATLKPDAGLYYKNTEAHLRDELRRLDLLIARSIAGLRTRQHIDPGIPASRGLFISDAEVDALLDETELPPADIQVSGRIDNRLTLLQKTIDDKLTASADRGVVLALPRLAALFSLSPIEVQAVVICLAPELRRKYDVLYAYLQDDITRKKPSVDLVLDLTCASEDERWRRLSVFSEHGALARHDIIHWKEDLHSPSGSSALARFLALDTRILHYLLGDTALDDRLGGSLQRHPPAAGHQAFDAHPAARNQLTNLLGHRASDPDSRPPPLTVYLQGPRGVGKRALASNLCEQFHRPMLLLDLELLQVRAAHAASGLRRAFRESILNQAILYIESMDRLTLGKEEDTAWLTELMHCLENSGGLTFLAGTKPWPVQRLRDCAAFCAVELPIPAIPERQAAWTHALAKLDIEAAPHWAGDLAGRFRLTPGQILDAARRAEQSALMREGESAFTLGDLYSACRHESRHKLGDLAVKIEPRCDWQDIVLPQGKLDQLQEICSQLEYRHRVYGQWGFGKKLPRGRGLSVLFFGASGTGKTMAAEVIAHALHLELYRIDLSGVVSKYIGETEKNLGRVFDAAETANAILFFDEADALFGKRTRISDAHDRYANIETSYLLQRMEAHDGMVILASNLRENMDEAFKRRIRFIVEFPFPDAAGRQAIWRKHFPLDAPVSEDLDFQWLGQQFQIAGGNIKNIALNAAFLAAADGGTITMDHVVRGARREFEKIGKLWDETFSHHPGA